MEQGIKNQKENKNKGLSSRIGFADTGSKTKNKKQIVIASEVVTSVAISNTGNQKNDVAS